MYQSVYICKNSNGQKFVNISPNVKAIVRAIIVKLRSGATTTQL